MRNQSSIWSCRSVNRWQDLSVTFKLLLILSCFTNWGDDPPPLLHLLWTPLYPLLLFSTLSSPLLQSIHPHTPVAEYTPSYPCCRVYHLIPLLQGIPPHTPVAVFYPLIPPVAGSMIQGYQITCSTMCMKAGPLETCVQGLPFIVVRGTKLQRVSNNIEIQTFQWKTVNEHGHNLLKV